MIGLGDRRLGGGLHRGIRCVGYDRLGHNFLQRYRSGDRVSTNTLHSANDARTAWDTASMKVAA